MEAPKHSGNARSVGSHGTMLVAKDDVRTAAVTNAESQHVDLDQPALVGMTTPYQGFRFPLRNGKTTVGRRADNDLVLTDGSVSAMHAWVIEDQGRYRVMNILSTNGTFVNDQRIIEIEVKHGDRIRFGALTFELHTGKRTAQLDPRVWQWVVGGIVLVGVLGAISWFAGLWH
ncbi:FHA domain-containing protein [Halothiobacillus diazotrophicus]|nr:FHA domain-containing protein [Halothiobacillus diazotrophicus]